MTNKSLSIISLAMLCVHITAFADEICTEGTCDNKQPISITLNSDSFTIKPFFYNFCEPSLSVVINNIVISTVSTWSIV